MGYPAEEEEEEEERGPELSSGDSDGNESYESAQGPIRLEERGPMDANILGISNSCTL